MKIRAITIGLKIPLLAPNTKLENFMRDKLQGFSNFNQELIERFKSLDIEVQTKRFCSQPILSYEHQLFDQNLNQTILTLHDQFTLIEYLISNFGFDYFACCTVLADQHVEKYGIYEKLLLDEVPSFIRRKKKFFTSLPAASSQNGINLAALRSGAKIIKKLSNPDPFNNLHFCVSANVKEDTPFFPASYHLSEKPSFSLALEMADEVVKVFEQSKNATEALIKLRERFNEIYDMLIKITENIGSKYGIDFHGMDFSPAPYPTIPKSIGTAFEKLNYEYFGAPGSLLGVALIKNAIPQKEKIIGFSGFMPSVLEDYTISKSLSEKKFNLDTLLLYSTMCGTGLDCVPLPGDITEQELFYILLDVCTISLRLNKPLTARLMPIPGRNAGDDVDFDFEYFASSKIMNIRRLAGDNKNDIFHGKEKSFNFFK
ncbi:MAG: DUF711 family protein [Candidatus Lokiarchaeota archaeon]|nr:DUF711 family protein [Candidatus Lokiarchaeota archaeon]